MTNRPYVLTIAGFDPSGGAGILADIKTFEMLGAYGLAAVTSNTFQHDSEFVAVDWIPVKKVLQQLKILLEKYPVQYAKIGLIRNYSFLRALISYLKKRRPDMQIVWDPILRSTTGFELLNGQPANEQRFLQKLSLITPNWKEAQQLWPGFERRLSEAGQNCPVLIKGGHRIDKPGTDLLITPSRTIEFSGRPFGGKSKHGTGCVFSAAVTAFLARGASLDMACIEAKAYTEQFILSNPSNLGYHYHHEHKD